MDLRNDENELNRLGDAEEALEDAAETLTERPPRKKKRRPRNPDGTPVRRPRPAQNELTAEDVAAEAERLFAGKSEDGEQAPDRPHNPHKKRRPKNPDGTPVRRPRPETADAETLDSDAPERPRKKRRPRPEEAEGAEGMPERRPHKKHRPRPEADVPADETDSLLSGIFDDEEDVPRRKRRPRPEEAAEEQLPQIPEEDAAVSAPDEDTVLDLDWRNDPEFADDADEEKPSFFARLFGGKKNDEDEEYDMLPDEEQDAAYRSDDGDDSGSYDDEAYYDDEDESASGKHRILIPAIIAVCLIAVAVTVGCVMYVKKQPQKMLDLINHGDYSGAAEYYQNHSYAESGEIDKAIDAQSDLVLQKYMNGQIEYETAIGEMKQLEQIQAMRARTDFNCTDAVELIHESRTHFEAGREALAQKQYDNAIEEFNKTCEADAQNYAEAQKLIKEAEDGKEKVRNDAIQSIIAEANTIAQNDLDYLAAYKKIEASAAAYDNDSRLTDAMNELKDSYIQEKLRSADSLAADKKYDDALNLLQIADTEMPGTAEFPAKTAEIQKAKEAYDFAQRKEAKLAEAAQAFDLSGAENAILILQAATEFANDPDIKAKIAEYESLRATDITDLTVVHQDTAVKDVDTAKTAKGKELKNALQFQYLAAHEKLKITYSDNNASYERLSFTAAADEDFFTEANLSLTVNVYADGALVYTSEAINAETDPIEVSATFQAGAKDISIVVTRSGVPDDAYKWKRLYLDIYNIKAAKK